MTNMKCYPTLSTHQMVDILVLFALSEERKSVENNIKQHKRQVPTLIPGGGGLLNRSAGYAPGLFVLTHQGKVSI